MVTVLLAALLTIGACSDDGGLAAPEPTLATSPPPPPSDSTIAEEESQFGEVEECDPEVSVDPCPGEGDPTGMDPREGFQLGSQFSFFACKGGSPDVDLDNLDDDCELKLAQTFLPVYYLHPDENCAQADPYWAATIVSSIAVQVIRILYAHAYREDCGNPGGITAHKGDSEFVAIDVWLGSGGWAMVDRVFTSAHYGEGIKDRSQWHHWDDISYEDGILGGRPKIVVSKDKHANYNSVGTCLALIEACSWANPSSIGFHPGHNLMSSSNPLGCVTSNLSIPTGTEEECFWSFLHPFYGWQERIGGGSGTYAPILFDFGF